MTQTTTAFQEHLESLGACDTARVWAGQRTATETWEQCARADWLLWWAANTKANTRQQVVLAACACARRALRFVSEGEDRPRLAIEAAERWAAEPTDENRRAAEAREAAARAAAAWAAEHKEMCGLIRGMLVQPWREE